MSFEIKLPLFEGPFDLLLFFIEKDELNIYDIPIAKITDDFLAYLQHLEQKNIDVAGEFMLVAATLMRIKAKMLLPRPVLDEQGEEIDPRAELVQHLLEYKKYKAVAKQIAEMETDRLSREQRGNIVAEIKAIAQLNQVEAELQDIDLYKLLKVYMRVMNRYKDARNRPVHQVIPYPYTIEQQRQVILQMVKAYTHLSFAQVIAASGRNRIAVIFNFLAVLDLLQAGSIVLQAVNGYNDFIITEASETDLPQTAEADAQ